MTIPRGPQGTKAARDLLTTRRCAMSDRATSLTEPWKTHVTGLKRAYDEAIALLPPTDQTPVPMELELHLRCLYSMWDATEDVLSLLAEKPDARFDQNQKTASMSAGRQFGSAVAGEPGVEREVGARFKEGDLVPRDFCMELCRMAKEAGIKEGEKKVRDELAAYEARKQLIAKRRGLVQTRGLAMPGEQWESILAEPEAEFQAALIKVSSRVEALQKRGLALNSESALAGNLWLPDEFWPCFEELLAERAAVRDQQVAPGTPASRQPPRVMIV